MGAVSKRDIEVTALIGLIDAMLDDVKESKQEHYHNRLRKLQDCGILRIKLEAQDSIYKKITEN